MKYKRDGWISEVADSFKLFFYCVFQPNRFRREFETEGFFKRVIPMLKQAIPIFIFSYPIALVTKIVLFKLSPGLMPGNLSLNALLTATPNLGRFLLETALSIVEGLVFVILSGAVGGIAIGTAMGMAFCLALGIAAGMVGGLGLKPALGIFSNTSLGITLGVTLGVAFGISGGVLSVMVISLTREKNMGVAASIIAGLATGVALVIVSLIIENIKAGVPSGIVGSLALVVGTIIAFVILWFNARSTRIKTIGSVALGIIGTIALVIVIYILYQHGGIQVNFVAGVPGAIVSGVVAGILSGTMLGSMIGPTAVFVGGIAGLILGAVAGGMQVGIVLGIAFFVSFFLGYYRLLLYPASGLSVFLAYLACRKAPLEALKHLHHSALYWDEYVFLPLPYLKHILLIVADQDVEQALEEIAFIAADRSLQISAAQGTSLEIAIRDLESCNNIQDIARASLRLAKILPQEMGLVDPMWVTPFARLNDASRDAARYCSPLGWQARYHALEDMMANLKRVYPNTVFRDARFSKRLGLVVGKWQETARYELERMEQAPENAGQIDNPYIPGPALEIRNSLFVGRRDLVQQLEEALGKGSHRPTFFLNGERRMGKTSTLKQLPNLLGSQYLPISYDLQTRGISSSAAAFLATVSEEISKAMSTRGMSIKKLEYVQLREIERENEAAAYYLFNEWLKGAEPILGQENRTLLLLFDEFEKLEEAGQEGYLNLRLLLDWFRSVIQNYPRMALLFSGVRSLSEMGAKWAGYFVNVQTLRVSFLSESEALQLITQPVPGYPYELIFGTRVVDEIIRVTGCHPFLVQAICSALIDSLNAEDRSQAEFKDVASSVDRVLENWWDTYFRDLWERTDQEQRECLIAVKDLYEGHVSKIAQQSDLDEKTVRKTMQVLLRRDLVLLEQQIYRISTPIFNEWIERNR